MAGGQLQRLTPGQPLGGISAGTWNRFADATTRVEGMAAGALSALVNAEGAYTVELVNDTGAARDPFQVVKYDESGIDFPASTSDVPENVLPVAKAKSPVAGDAFAILLEGLGGDEEDTCRAMISGLAYALVDIVDASHVTCGPASGQYSHLDSGLSGAAIVGKATAGTGLQWCIVRVGGAVSTSLERGEYVTVRIIDDVPPRTTATVAARGESAGQIVEICSPAQAGNPTIVTINGLEYNFASKSAGDIVDPISGGIVDLLNVSRSKANSRSDPFVFGHAKYIGEGADPEVDPPWYELISPLEPRTVTGWDGALDVSLGADAVSTEDEVQFQQDGDCD